MFPQEFAKNENIQSNFQISRALFKLMGCWFVCSLERQGPQTTFEFHSTIIRMKFQSLDLGNVSVLHVFNQNSNFIFSQPIT